MEMHVLLIVDSWPFIEYLKHFIPLQVSKFLILHVILYMLYWVKVVTLTHSDPSAKEQLPEVWSISWRETTWMRLLPHSPEEVASGPRILCWVMFTAGPWMLNQPIILRQPFQQKNLCWDDCTFGRVHLKKKHSLNLSIFTDDWPLVTRCVKSVEGENKQFHLRNVIPNYKLYFRGKSHLSKYISWHLINCKFNFENEQTFSLHLSDSYWMDGHSGCYCYKW